MKTFTKLAIFMIAYIFSISIASAQVAGDIAIIAGNADNDDQFAFVALADIPASTIITFTDNSWSTANGPFLTNEGYAQWSHTDIVTAGTVITVTGTGDWATPSVTLGSIAEFGSMGFSNSGDQIIAFKGAWADRPTTDGADAKFLYAFSWENFITTGTTNTNTSYLPSALASYSAAMTTSATETDNAYFANGNTAQTSVAVSGTKEELLTLFNDGLTKYYLNNTGPLTFPSYTVTVSSGGGLTPPTLTPDITNNDVDHSMDITFTDNATWRAAITAVKINGTEITVGVDYVISAGNLQLIPSGGNSLLTTAGTKLVNIEATGYSNASATQQINAGAVTSASTAVISSALVLNSTRTVTCTAKDQYNNLVSGYTFKFDLTVTDNNPTTDEAYLIDGISYTASSSDVSLSTTTNASGVATFTIQIPAIVDGSDGMNLQVQLFDGSTNIGTAFPYINLAPVITLTGNDPATIPFYPATNSNILYMVKVDVTNDASTLSQVSFTTAGTYSSTDITASGFTLRYSVDNILTSGDATLGTLSSTTGAGEVLTFTGLTQSFVIGSAYIFVTANIDAAATVGHTLSAQTFTNTDFVFSGSPTFSGSLFNSPNLHTISAIPTLTELVIPQFLGSKSAASANTCRTPIAYCVKIDNLIPLTSYDIKIGIGLTSEAATSWGAGNLWNGTAFSGQTMSNAFTTDASGTSGAIWFYVQPTGNGSRFGGGQVHNVRIGYTVNGSALPTNPNFVTTKTTTTLDIATTALTAETTDDGAFVKGMTPTSHAGKYVLIYNNEAGTGDPMYAFQVRTAIATNSSQADLPSAINEVYAQVAPSVEGDFAAVVPIGANNPDGVRRIELRNADNTLFGSYTSPTGNWGGGALTNDITRREVDTIDLSLAGEPTNNATGFTAGITTTTTIPLSWTDATGAILPENYIIKGSSVGFGDITAPVDGTPEANSSLVQNVAYGIENYTFTGLTPNTTYYFKIYPYNGTGSSINYKTGTGTPEVSATTMADSKTLNLTVLLEGLYAGAGVMNKAQDENGFVYADDIADVINVELRSATDGSLVFEAQERNIYTNGGIQEISVPSIYADDYFIVIKHRNHIETWSASAISFSGGAITYDFSNSQAMAYGNNLKDIGGLFVLYAGDVNQDWFCDSSDLDEVFNNSSVGAQGYLVSDLTGDSWVDSSDLDMVFNNSSIGIQAILPF